jgi:serpin B
MLVSGLVIGLLLLLASCGTGDPPDPSTTTSTGEQGDPTTTTGSSTVEDGVLLASSDLSRVSPSAPRTNVLSASTAVGALGDDLYSVLAKDAAGGNLVVSPSSIVTALAMAYAGAVGPTADEMAEVLHFELTGDDLHQAFNALNSLLESRSWQGKDPDGREQGVLVKTANSLWAQRDLAFEGAFLDDLAANYGAGVRLVDYKTAVEAARKAINDWVAGQTEDKITDLIPQGALDELTRLVLVNAVYLDATWASPFDKNLTDGQFTTLNGTVVTADDEPIRGFGYAEGYEWQAVELPYVPE